jgi:hypothetical protein
MRKKNRNNNNNLKIPRMKLQTEATIEGWTHHLYFSEVQLNEAEIIELMAFYTFHVDFESPVFADRSISCNSPGENFRTQKLNEIIRSESKWS